MKKQYLMVAVMAALSVNAFGQGQVTLANNSSSLITDIATGQPIPVNSPVSFQLYSGPTADALISLFPTTGVSSVLVGRIATMVYDIPAAPNGEVAFFQIRSFSNAFATYDDAVGAASWISVTPIFQSNTSLQSPGGPPPIPVTLAGKFAGFPVVIPEPSSGALMLLSGIACYAILWTRSRKSLISVPAAKSSWND